MSDLISREAAIAVATSCPDSHWGPWVAERIRALPAVQPDAAAIREAALKEVLESLAAEVDQMRRIWRRANNANKMRRELEADGAFELLAVLAGMISIGKEVMPVATQSPPARHDIGPGDQAQAVAGAAQCCMCGKNGLSTEEDGGPECELHDGRWVCSSGCYDVALGIMLKPVAGAAPDGDVEREIDALRLKAFRTNAPSDREAYFMATSKWFQDRHYRYMAAQKGDSHE